MTRSDFEVIKRFGGGRIIPFLPEGEATFFERHNRAGRSKLAVVAGKSYGAGGFRFGFHCGKSGAITAARSSLRIDNGHQQFLRFALGLRSVECWRRSGRDLA